MLPFLLLVFVALPIVELFLLLEVGEALGAWDTVAIVLITGFVGAFVARNQGQMVWRGMQKKLQQGQLPADSMLEGLMIFIGGLLLITPGFITDVLGFAMVLPGTRRACLILFRRFLRSRMRSGQFQVRVGHMDPSGVHWTSSEQIWRDVSPDDRPSIEEPADVIDINSARNKKPNQ